ncbi:hypothetical protein D9M68_758290 [compost metagenome]
MEELGLERPLFRAPERLLGTEADVAHLVVVEGGEVRGEFVAVCAVGRLCAGPGELAEGVPVKALGLRGSRGQHGQQRDQQGSAARDAERWKRVKRGGHALIRANPVPALKNPFKSIGYELILMWTVGWASLGRPRRPVFVVDQRQVGGCWQKSRFRSTGFCCHTSATGSLGSVPAPAPASLLNRPGVSACFCSRR